MRAPLPLALAALLGLPASGARGDDLAARAERTYVLDTARSTTALAVGGRGVLVVAIRCEPGVHVQPQAPLRLTASASPGLVLARERLGWSDARGTPDAPELELPVTASAPGPQAARVRLEFFVCSKHWCVRQDRELVLPVAVEGAAAAPNGSSSPLAPSAPGR